MLAGLLMRTASPPLIDVPRPPAEIADAIGMTRRESIQPRRRGEPSCRDCFFHRHVLCTLDIDQPCSTFRLDGPNGLVPPVQPSLLPRQGAAA
jgi:hypothetical protein